MYVNKDRPREIHARRRYARASGVDGSNGADVETIKPPERIRTSGPGGSSSSDFSAARAARDVAVATRRGEPRPATPTMQQFELIIALCALDKSETGEMGPVIYAWCSCGL